MAATGNAQWIHPTSVLVATNLSDLRRLMPFALQMVGETGARLERRPSLVGRLDATRDRRHWHCGGPCVE